MKRIPSAATKGRRMREVSMGWLSFESKQKHDYHAGNDEERIGLQIAGLHKAQRAAENVRGARYATHAQAGNNPAINPVRQSRERFVSDSDHDSIELIEIEKVPHGPIQS